MQPAPSFDPAVTVSALALRNLSNLPYVRLVLSHPPAEHPVAQRARWLEPGVGQTVALPAAAVSLLAEQLPSALVAVLRPNVKPPKPPALYVFGARPTIAAATDILRDAFVPDEILLWTPDAPALVTTALTFAIHRAIVHALEASGAIRVGEHLILPDSSLSYAFSVSLGHGKQPHMLIRVSVKHTAARRITDDDCAAALHTTLPVFAAPMGITATLAPRPVAGDALTSSVIKRWREGGLLPSSDLSDSTVVFLTVNGVDVPFPRVVILTNEAATPEDPPKVAEKPLAKKPQTGQTNLWRSRKRPRSPMVAEDSESEAAGLRPEVQQQQQQQQQQQKPPAMVEAVISDAPTAASLNAALEAQGAKSDPSPTLRHPLVEPITPPTFHHFKENAKSEPQEVDISEEKTTSNDSTQPKEPTSSVNEQPESGEGEGIKAEPINETTQNSNGIDGFLLDGDSNTNDGFDTGPGMDMTDFSFEDDVTKFFRDGMDDRLQDIDEDPPALEDEDNQKGVLKADQDTSDAKDGSQEDLAGAADPSKSLEYVKMDIDDKPSAWDAEKDDKVSPNAEVDTSFISAIEVVNVALSALRKPLPSTRPQREAVKTQLSSFFEKDLTERRHIRLGAARTIEKPRARSKWFGKFAAAELKAVQTRLQTPQVDADKKDAASLFEKLRPLTAFRPQGPLYVPRRKVKAYTRLHRNGVVVKTPASLVDDVLSESSASDDEERNLWKKNVGEKAQSSADLYLSMNVPNHSVSRPMHSSSSVGAPGQPAHQDDQDPLRIADTVAVDCASACMVLTAGSDLGVHATMASTALNGPGISHEATEPAPNSKEEDAKAGAPLLLSQGPPKPSTHAPHLKAHAMPPQAASITRSPGKRDRDMFALLSLLEMQLFSMNELSIFGEENATDGTTTTTRKHVNVAEAEAEHVSSATMRRVLLGLPRALEKSHSFSNCFASFREDKDQDSSKPAVKGPLSVNDFLGGSATIFPLESPRVCVGYNNEWMEASSKALPLWEKVGFEPYSERKNIEYVAVAPKDLDDDVKLFLRDLSAAYEECSFGKHAAMPFDAVTLIANSVAKATGNGKPKLPGVLSEVEKAMTEQYHLAVTGLCTKLAAVTRDHRKNPTGNPSNIVAYIVSPFGKGSKAANVSLLRAVAPLVSAVPGTVPSMVSTTALGPALSPAPWRSSSAAKSVVSVTVRVIPREVVERKLSGRAEVSNLLRRPLRPQLMKAVSFAVFNSIRFKRVRVPSLDGEVSSLLSRASLMPDELMSPMTPDIIAESPNGNVTTPVSPIGPSSEDSAHGSMSAPHNAALLDQSSALSPSFLHEPVVVLAGAGRHMNQTESRANIVLHLAYAFCESSSRLVFAWTDQRGEMLDMASVPVCKIALRASRRKAFWGMWARGQRWRISYVEEVHGTVSKLGPMATGELEDWDWVINKVNSSSSSSSEKKPDSGSFKALARRFPPPPHPRGEDISESDTDAPTPATHALQPSVGSGSGGKSSVSMDIKMPPMASVSVLSVCEADSHLFMEKSSDDNTDRRDFAVVSDTSLGKGQNVQASAILARFDEDSIRAIEVNVLRHYGIGGESEDMSDDRSIWDCYDVRSIANTIAVNFHELRCVASPPSWPQKRWLSMYPLHLDAVRGFKANLKQVHNFAFMSQTSAAR